jgi:CHAD domain-containing protein
MRDLQSRDPPPKSAADASPNPDRRADAALKLILLKQLEILERHEAGALRNEETESLHDFRIAVRRARTVLNQLKGVLPERAADRLSAKLAWLGQSTSEARDLDVYLEDFEALKTALPLSFQADIEHLRGFLENRADLAHGELARCLHSRQYRSLLTEWRRFAAAPVPKRPSAPHARKPIRDLANARIFKLYRRVLKQGRQVRPETPDEHLHELRKTCKKLRYLLEFFRDFHPREEIAQLVGQLKTLQDYLGEHQDIHARIDKLRRLAPDMRLDPNVPAAALLAMGALLDRLETRQLKLRKHFPECFAPFAHARNRAGFRRLFHSCAQTGLNEHKQRNDPAGGDSS